MATAPGHFNAFDATMEDWESYISRFEFFLDSSETEEEEKKCTTFFRVCGRSTFEIARSLIAPAELKNTDHKMIFERLKELFEAFRHHCPPCIPH